MEKRKSISYRQKKKKRKKEKKTNPIHPREKNIRSSPDILYGTLSGALSPA